jgi:hypothetical protein
MTTGAKIWKSIEKKRNNYERKFSLYARRVLNQQFADVASHIDVFNYSDPNLVTLFVNKEPIERLLQVIYTNVGTSFAKDEYRKLKGINEALEFKAEDEELWYQELINYVRMYCGTKITSITMSSREKMLKIIREAIDQAVAEGLGASETAAYVQRALKVEGTILNKWRALRIARTEVMTASNRGALLGGKEAGATVKYWIATYDNRTRDTHKVMESQNPKGIDEMFLVGGYEASGPGDERLPAEEVINCRCAISFGML